MQKGVWEVMGELWEFFAVFEIATQPAQCQGIKPIIPNQENFDWQLCKSS
jgi:hypothetical protein